MLTHKRVRYCQKVRFAKDLQPKMEEHQLKQTYLDMMQSRNGICFQFDITQDKIVTSFFPFQFNIWQILKLLTNWTDILFMPLDIIGIVMEYAIELPKEFWRNYQGREIIIHTLNFDEFRRLVMLSTTKKLSLSCMVAFKIQETARFETKTLSKVILSKYFASK